MQIQIQNVNLSTNSNSKNTRNLQKGAPVDFCSENRVAHFFVVKTELSGSLFSTFAGLPA
jgi:hypothetical protein